MSKFPRPIIVVSKCLGFASCRYDGQVIPSSFVESMKPFVDFICVCPECEIGLGVPRDPIRIVLDGKKRLVQPATGIELTQKMERFADSYLEELDDFDGFILKSRSPSCGMGTTKVYPNAEGKNWLNSEENGFFADAVFNKYPHLPAVDEVQVNDLLIRDHFLTVVFTLSSFREASSLMSMHSLIEYHTRNKLLLMAYDKQLMLSMGNVVANREKRPVEMVFGEYLDLLLQILSKPAETGSTINAMLHSFGYISRYLGAQEKFIFLQKLQGYREDSSVLLELKERILSWSLQFNVEYISEQTFLCPYPQKFACRDQNGNFR
ncbi:DUF523 and DUF1722 domain-containing protein [Methanolobus sp. ZRKC2]|uniref:YbgA family protein n=1 Tax=Methanolobus sp. ZRKC2 TaxID=3125783 RepID=UPI0032431647